ncbi:hypothetical protein emb_1c0549 [Coriobacteriaceae bacterium EMTCatB1]|nr:hypothetical protein emb_1c0549 [Coriobacteriaceae bacterium EMTCatB1]
MEPVMIREWLMRPEVVLWSFGWVPVALLLAYVSIMGVRSRRRAERPLATTKWVLPVAVLFMAYYMWGFQVPLPRAAVYVTVGAICIVVGAFLLEGVYLGTIRALTGGVSNIQSSADDSSSLGSDNASNPKESDGAPRP